MNTERSLWMEGLLWAEEYIDKGVFFEDDKSGLESLSWTLLYSGEFGFEAGGEFLVGALDYLDYLEHLHNSIMLPLSNINKDNNPQGDKMVTLPKDFDQACKNFHTREESRCKQALRKKIDNRKQELSKFGFKENIRW